MCCFPPRFWNRPWKGLCTAVGPGGSTLSVPVDEESIVHFMNSVNLKRGWQQEHFKLSEMLAVPFLKFVAKKSRTKNAWWYKHLATVRHVFLYHEWSVSPILAYSSIRPCDLFICLLLIHMTFSLEIFSTWIVVIYPPKRSFKPRGGHEELSVKITWSFTWSRLACEQAVLIVLGVGLASVLQESLLGGYFSAKAGF